MEFAIRMSTDNERPTSNADNYETDTVHSGKQLPSTYRAMQRDFALRRNTQVLVVHALPFRTGQEPVLVNDRSRIICRPHQITQCPPIPPLLFLEFSVVGLFFVSCNCRGCLISLPLRCSLLCRGLLGILGLSGSGFLIPQCREPGIGVSDLGQFGAYLGIVMESRTCRLSTLDSPDELSCRISNVATNGIGEEECTASQKANILVTSWGAKGQRDVQSATSRRLIWFSGETEALRCRRTKSSSLQRMRSANIVSNGAPKGSLPTILGHQ